MIPTGEGRVDRIAPWVAGTVLALPVLALRYPPMTDLPLHEGMVALLRHFGDPAFMPPNLYELNLGHANQLVYLLATPLAFVVSTALACKLVAAAAIVLTVTGAAHLASYFGTTRWTALSIAPIVVGWTYSWGFLPNMLGLAAFLWFLPSIDRACETPTARRVAGACAIAALLLFAHEALALALCVATLVLALVRPFDAKTPLRLAPLVVVALGSVVEMAREKSVATPLARVFAKQIIVHPLSTKLLCVTSFLVGARGYVIEVTLLAPALGIAVYGAIVRARRRAPSDPSWRARAHRERFALVAVALLFAYFSAPYSVNFGAFLYERFLAPSFIVAVLFVAPSAPRAIAKLVAAVAPVAALLVALPELANANMQHTDLEALYPRIERASATFAFHLGGVGDPTLYSQASAANRLLAERGGRLEFSFAEYPIAPVIVHAAYEWSDTLLRLYADPSNLRPSVDMDRFRYLLIHTTDDGLAEIVQASLAPDARLVAQSGQWSLYESTHVVVPLTSGDAPPSDPPTSTLRTRIGRTLGQIER